MRSGNRKKYLAIAIALTLVLQFSFFGSAKVSATEIDPSEQTATSQSVAAQDEQPVTIDETGEVPLAVSQTEDASEAESAESEGEQNATEQVTPAPAEAQEQTAASTESAAPAKATGDQPENQPAKASSSKKVTASTTKAQTITIKADNVSKIFKDNDPELTYTISGLPDGVSEDTLRGCLLQPERESGENAGTYKILLDETYLFEIPEGLEDCTFNFESGTFTILPRQVTVTITGHNFTARYDGKVHHASGYDVSHNYNTHYVKIKDKKLANVNKRKPGKRMMGLKASMFENTNPNYDVTFKIVDGYVKVYPKDGPVPEPEEEDDNNGSNGSNGNNGGNGGNGNGGYYDSNGNYVPYGNGNNGGYYDDNGNYVSYNDGNGNNNGGNNGNGNGTSEQADGQNGDDNGGTEAIDDNDTPKTDGSGTETIDDSDTPKTDGDEADDGSDTMPSMLPIILIILAIIAAFLLLLFSRKKRDNEQ